MTDTPLNALETVIHNGLAGTATPADLHAALLDATLYVPSADEIVDGQTFAPIMIPSAHARLGNVVVFTDRSRITDAARGHAPYVFEASGRDFVFALPPELGMTVFADGDAAVELDPMTLHDIRITIYPNPES